MLGRLLNFASFFELCDFCFFLTAAKTRRLFASSYLPYMQFIKVGSEN